MTFSDLRYISVRDGGMLVQAKFQINQDQKYFIISNNDTAGSNLPNNFTII